MMVTRSAGSGVHSPVVRGPAVARAAAPPETADTRGSRHVVTRRTSPTHLATAVHWILVAVILLSLVVTIRSLPSAEILVELEGWLSGLGLWGPAALALIYMLATILLVPGTVLTLAAGAIFGLAWGTVAASAGATAGAAMTFLIARFLARERVARLVSRSPRFDAIDRAIGERGWRIVALLRLSPAVPFNLQNYLYGVTAIRFWPCVLTSWLAMLPATFLYVAIGHAGRQGLEAAAGAEQPAGMGRLALLAVGLAATALVTVMLARVAMRAIRDQNLLASASQDGSAELPDTEEARAGSAPRWRTAAMAVAALATAGLAACATLTDGFRALLGPPPVVLQEVYTNEPGGPTFDHGLLNGLLQAHVDAAGWVDYAGLHDDAATLDRYLESLQQAPLDDLGRDEKLALLINAYNAFTLRLVLDHWDGGRLQSIRHIDSPWDQRRWRLGRSTWSLNEIEHEQIRPKFREPRIHFALVCAAVGCPKLRNEAYAPGRLEEQLEDQARFVHGSERWIRLRDGGKTVELTKLYQWYGSDFEQVAGSVLAYAARYAPALRDALDEGATPRIRWMNYDWSLNDRRAAH